MISFIFSLEGRKEEVFGSSYCIILGFLIFFLIALRLALFLFFFSSLFFFFWLGY